MAKTLDFTDMSPRTVKIGDTTTSFTLICGNNNMETDLTNATSITVKLGNASGYLKSVTVDPPSLTDSTTDQVTVTFTADLMNSLPAGNYYIEVWVVDNNGTSIYPSDAAVGFTIENNIESTTGNVITTIAFDEFVEAMNKAASTIAKGDKGDKGDTGTVDNVGLTTAPAFVELKTQVDNQENDLNNNINSKLAQISSVPETFANLAALKNAYPNGKTGIFVTADTGHKYIWANNVWTDAGIYQSVGVADASIHPIKLQDNARSTPIILSGPGGAPNYDDKTKTLTFNSMSNGSAILFWSNKLHYEIPLGTTVFNDAANKYTSTKLIFDTSNSVFEYVAWNINLSPTQFVVLAQKESWGNPTGQTIISANFPVTVNGRLQGSSHKWARIIPSTLLKPDYSDVDHIFDFNSSKRRSFNTQGKWEPLACLVLDSQNAQSTSTFEIPQDTRIVNKIASGSKSSWSMLVFNANDKTFRFQMVSSNLRIADWIVAVIRDNTWDSSNLEQTTVTVNGPVTVNGLDNSLVQNPKNANVRGILHRGVSDYAPEESWQAYQLAYQFGYYNVEGDIHFTKDGVPVMIHDETINRVAVNKSDKSNIVGDVAVVDNNYQDLLDKYDYCKINGNAQKYYYGTSLLTFDDLLKICRKYNYALHAELKIEMTDAQIEQLVHLARSYGMDNNIFWQSSNPDWFKHLKEIAPDSNFCFLITTDPTENLIATMKSYQTGLLHGKVYAYVSHSVDKSKLVTYKENGIDVVVWTFYSDAAIQDWGLNTCVNGIMVQGDVNVARALMRA